MLDGLLQPWHSAVSHPAQAQQEVLRRLLKGYAESDYGAQRGAAQVETIAEYRCSFPPVTYEDLRPLIQRVLAGETHLLLNEEPVGWAITRGTTGDEPKFIPMTPTDLMMRISAGRAIMNYVAVSERYDIFDGVNLNLNFPSVVGSVRAGDREIDYGYSSGIYARHVSTFTPVRSAPAQEEIDALGGGKTVRDWEARFELAYEKCKGENVTLVGRRGPHGAALRPLPAPGARHVSQEAMVHTGDDPGQRAGHQHAASAGADCPLRAGGHPRDIRRH